MLGSRGLYLDGCSICWDSAETRYGSVCLKSVGEDVVGCHGEDGGSCRHTGERPAGPGDVHMRVGQRLVRIHSVLFFEQAEK